MQKLACCQYFRRPYYLYHQGLSAEGQELDGLYQDQVKEINHPEPEMRRGEMQPCLSQQERAFCGWSFVSPLVIPGFDWLIAVT
jgi:hypothetical protein